MGHRDGVFEDSPEHHLIAWGAREAARIAVKSSGVGGQQVIGGEDIVHKHLLSWKVIDFKQTNSDWQINSLISNQFGLTN